MSFGFLNAHWLYAIFENVKISTKSFEHIMKVESYEITWDFLMIADKNRPYK